MEMPGTVFFPSAATDSAPQSPVPMDGGKRKFVDDNFYIPDGVKSFVAARMESFECSAHDVDHVYRVANLAKTLAEYEDGADCRLAYIAGLMHDILDSKLSTEGEIEQFEVEFLNYLRGEEDFLTEQEIAKLFVIIKSIGFKKLIRDDFDPSDLPCEYRCVQDADLLDAIGAVGVSRCFSFGGKRNRKLFGVTCDIRPPGETIEASEYGRSQSDHNATGVDHFFDKLLTIQSKMQTEHGKKLASKRHEFMILFLKELDEELSESKAMPAGAIRAPAQTFSIEAQGTASERIAADASSFVPT